jgi:hypothetical protein
MQILKLKTQAGLALTSVLVFGAVAMIVITLGITLTIIQSGASLQFTSAQRALAAAESGMENALIRLLRDPNYSGETLTLDAGTATITVSEVGGNKAVTVIGDNAGVARTIQVILIEENGSSRVQSWQEI